MIYDSKTHGPSEAQEQMALMHWAQWQVSAHPELKLLHHIPNGGSRTRSEAGRFKAMGVKAGVPDLFLPVARGGFHGLYIELKRETLGKTSAVQLGWISALRKEGYRVEVCHGWQAASDVIMDYIRK